ncbi:MAG: alpha/beta hydrolase family protein [Candidatus Saccharimonas sp.]
MGIIVTELAAPDHDDTVIVLPVLLASAAQYHRAMLDTLARHGRVVAFDRSRDQPTDWSLFLSELVQYIGQIPLSRRVTLVGSSMGGMQVPFVVAWLLSRFGQRQLDRLHVIVVDPPSGVDSMIGAKNSKRVGAMLTSPLGHVVRPLSWVKIGPRDEFIEIPSTEVMTSLAGESMQPQEWREWVKVTSVDTLRGSSSSTWLADLRWMVTVGRDGSLLRTCGLLERVASATYIACMGPGNDVVLQPHAAEVWQDTVPSLVVRELPTVHPGYLQQVMTFRSAFQHVLSI